MRGADSSPFKPVDSAGDKLNAGLGPNARKLDARDHGEDQHRGVLPERPPGLLHQPGSTSLTAPTALGGGGSGVTRIGEGTPSSSMTEALRNLELPSCLATG